MSSWSGYRAPRTSALISAKELAKVTGLGAKALRRLAYRLGLRPTKRGWRGINLYNFAAVETITNHLALFPKHLGGVKSHATLKRRRLSEVATSGSVPEAE